MRKFYVAIILFFLCVNSFYAIDYITTAESISWNGAYTTVSDGMEAMLYNPAGIFLSTRRFGLNILVSYGFRLYNNVFSSDDFIKMYEILGSDEPDITKVINNKLEHMPHFGMTMGLSAQNVFFMTFMRFSDFSLAFSLINKFNGEVVIGKGIFSTVLQNLNLTKPITVSINSDTVFYTDFTSMLSTRVQPLEKLLNVESIYAGFGVHVYLPLYYSKFKSSLTFTTSSPDPITGLYTYKTVTKGSHFSSGNLAFSLAAKELFASEFAEQIPELIRSLVSGDGTVGLGFGVDMGFIVCLNRYFRLGFSVTDIGFFVFPESNLSTFNFDVEINPTRFQAFAKDLGEELEKNIKSKMKRVKEPQFFVPDTAIRTGLSYIPVHNKNIDLLLAVDISLSSFDKILLDQYICFNFSTGLEARPKVSIFEFPFRMAFNYNSQANIASLSLGSGLCIGPVILNFGIKGLEILISEWGAKDFSMGVDLKFEF